LSVTVTMQNISDPTAPKFQVGTFAWVRFDFLQLQVAGGTEPIVYWDSNQKGWVVSSDGSVWENVVIGGPL